MKRFLPFLLILAGLIIPSMSLAQSQPTQTFPVINRGQDSQPQTNPSSPPPQIPMIAAVLIGLGILFLGIAQSIASMRKKYLRWDSDA